MNHVLIFDTETNGKANFKKPASDPSQPMIVQLAALLCDETGHEVSSLNTLVKTDGWDIPPEVIAVHGITKEKADTDGIALADAINEFNALVTQADVIVAHNFAFDKLIYDAAIHRLAVANIVSLKRSFCTMQATTNLCRIRSPWGYKWPKLIEAYRHLFNEGFEGAHDALADVRACARVYFRITGK